jgi:hypothetical protein
LELARCPFVNLPEKKRTMWALTREEMKNCRRLKPELVAQIEFAEWTPDGHLKFVGMREDKEAREVRREDRPVIVVWWFDKLLREQLDFTVSRLLIVLIPGGVTSISKRPLSASVRSRTGSQRTMKSESVT